MTTAARRYSNPLHIAISVVVVVVVVVAAGFAVALLNVKVGAVRNRDLFALLDVVPQNNENAKASMTSATYGSRLVIPGSIEEARHVAAMSL